MLNMNARFIYLKHHKKDGTQRPVQRIIPMKHVQYIELDPDTHAMSIQMIGAKHPDIYKPMTGDEMQDKELSLRLFYDLLKDARADGKVIEGW